MNAQQISSAKTAELVAFYNDHSGKAPINKFADRKTAERRVLALIEFAIAGIAATTAAISARAPAATPRDRNTCPSCGAKQDQTPAGLEGTAAEHRNLCHHCGTEYFPETGKIYKAPAASADRSRAIAQSWTNPAVAAARAQRTGVTVTVSEGTELLHGHYRSVLHAFQVLGLDVRGHIKFRMALKAAGKLAYNDKYTFVAQAQSAL